MIVFGQADYVGRISRYIGDAVDENEIKTFSFSLSPQDLVEYAFDFSYFDDAMDNIDRNETIIVAFETRYQFSAIEHVKNLGFRHIETFDSLMDNKLKKAFLKKAFVIESHEFSLLLDEKTITVYMAKSAVDKPLQSYPSETSSHVIPLQVGAALTTERIADLTDDTGDNISNRNRHYSETTALYWMWKNADADYLGLCHYRRLWKDLDKIAENLQNFVTDVVLPLPSWMEPSVMEGHLKHYTPDVWTTMMEVLRQRSPEYYDAAQKIYDGNIFYACNMLIAKRHVLNHLCSWMFPIVMEVEEIIGDLPDPYRNRYCGFCTEQLITLYFLYNKQNWRIAHAEKIFLE